MRVHLALLPVLLAVAATAAPLPAASKKGLQVQMVDDALALGIRHATLNVNLTSLIDPAHRPGSLAWTMEGETFHFHRGAVERIPVKPLSDAGVSVALILLTYESGDTNLNRLMLHPRRAARLPNHLAAFNTATPEGVKHLRACVGFLADRFSRPGGTNGRVTGYIVGNEVNSHWYWYNLGEAPRDFVIDEYLKAVRVVHEAVRLASPDARVYLSLEHHWAMPFQTNVLRCLPGKYLLDEFNRRARAGGDFDWHLAFHPYPENLFKPRTWRDRTALPSPDSPRITFKNLEQLTAYLERPEMRYHGAPRRVILSEQGLHSDNTPAGDLAQAAAYCYAWKKVEALDGIDAFILHRHVDHSEEGGLNLGLWKRDPKSAATPASPRPIYEVFRQADTPEWEEAFRFALPIIGITNWNALAPSVTARAPSEARP